MSAPSCYSHGHPWWPRGAKMAFKVLPWCQTWFPRRARDDKTVPGCQRGGTEGSKWLQNGDPAKPNELQKKGILLRQMRVKRIGATFDLTRVWLVRPWPLKLRRPFFRGAPWLRDCAPMSFCQLAIIAIQRAAYAVFLQYLPCENHDLEVPNTKKSSRKSQKIT